MLTLLLNSTPIYSVNFGVKALKVSGTGFETIDIIVYFLYGLVIQIDILDKWLLSNNIITFV